MEKERSSSSSPHVLAIPYPSQGHVNPMFQFSKRLASKGGGGLLKATLAITTFISTTTILPKSEDLVKIDTISDGYDQGGFTEAPDIKAYLDRLQEFGSKTLAELIKRHRKSDNPITCVIYDAFLPWALDVAKQHGLAGAAFFTQPCAVNYIYYCAHYGLLTLPLPVSALPVSIPGMPLLELEDMPSFIYAYGSYPAYFEMVLRQYSSNARRADYVFVNTFYELEDKVVDEMSKLSPMMTIGPTVPSFYLDKRVPNDASYDLNLFQLDDSSTCIDSWLNEKPKSSVVYVSFGSMVNLSKEQMHELAWGLKASSCYFLWVVKAHDKDKLPNDFLEGISAPDAKGLLVGWCPQLQVLATESVGCFFSHCGWNSTIEALSLGVPMVVMPQWTDQTTNAKFVQDVWRVGVRIRVVDENKGGIVGRDEVEGCIRQVMEGGDKGKELKKNSMKWRDLAVKAVSEGGSSDRNIDEFVNKLAAAASTNNIV